MKFTKPPADPIVNAMLYGPPKSGKTIGAGTSPSGILYLNCDLPDATRQVHLKHPDGSIFEPEMPDEGAGQLMSLMGEITRTVYDPKQDWIKTVVIDPVGELYRRLLEDFSNRAVSPSLPTYGAAGTQVERFVRAMCKAPVNCVIVAHEWGYEKAGDEGMTMGIWTGTKSGSVSLGQKLMGMVNVIGYTGLIANEAGEKMAVAQLFPAKGRQGGDRFDCLGAIRPLDISEWIEAIKAHERGKPVPVPAGMPDATPDGSVSTLTPEQAETIADAQAAAPVEHPPEDPPTLSSETGSSLASEQAGEDKPAARRRKAA